MTRIYLVIFLFLCRHCSKIPLLVPLFSLVCNCYDVGTSDCMWSWFETSPKPPGCSKEQVNTMLGNINAEKQTLSQRAASIIESKQAHATVSKVDSEASVLLHPEAMTNEERRRMSCSDVEQQVKLGFYYQDLLSKAKTSEGQSALSWPFNLTGDPVNQVEVSATNKGQGAPSVKVEMKSSQRISPLEHEESLKTSIRNTKGWLSSDKAWSCGISKKSIGKGD